MYRIAICDDEKKIRDYLETFVCLQIESVVSQFSGGRELLEAKQKFDMVLLDISMGDMNGIETAKAIRKDSDAVIIFITALKEYVFDAFDVEAFHYLLKPIDERKFKEIFQRAINEIEKRTAEESLLIKVASGYRKIPMKDIMYAENCGRKIILHTKREQIEFYSKMENLEQKTGIGFFRCHRGYLVHFKYVLGYDNTSISMLNGEIIFMAKKKYSEFVRGYMKYLKDEE